jgi:uncharacterized protein (DUF305 family)
MSLERTSLPMRWSPILGVLLASSVMAQTVAPVARHPDEAPFLAANDVAMSKMMAGMAVKPAGDIDRDFVAMMVPHHQGAIDMAQAELLYGHNQKLLRIAQEIIVEQLQEISAMHLAVGEPAAPDWVAEAPRSAMKAAPASQVDRAKEAPFLAQNNAAMIKMMADMAVKPTGDIDRDFVAMMVPHHQGAIDMAQAELRYGQNQQLKTIAQEIIVDQQQEITLMRFAVDESLPPLAAAPTQDTAAAAPAPAAGHTMMRMSPAMSVAPSTPAATNSR